MLEWLSKQPVKQSIPFTILQQVIHRKKKPSIYKIHSVPDNSNLCGKSKLVRVIEGQSYQDSTVLAFIDLVCVSRVFENHFIRT